MTVPSLDLDFRPPRRRSVLQSAMVVLAALAVGLLSLWQPVLAGVAGVALLALAFLAQVGARLPVYALGLIGISLVGYSVLGKGYAYLGVPPLFIGEVALLLGLLATVPAWWRHFPLRRTPAIVGTLLLFMLTGVINTLPHVKEYGLDALRDAAIWGYALFALIVATLVLQLGVFTRALEAYGRVLPLFLLAAPVGIWVTRLATNAVPVWPISGEPILYTKGGDVAVHLAGAMVFLLLGLHRLRATPHQDEVAQTPRRGAEWVWWGMWVLAAISMFTGRAALVTLGAVLVLTLVLRPLSRWGRPLFMVTLMVTLILSFNLRLNMGSNRELSIDGLLLNLQSITEETGTSAVDGSRTWRLRWWESIVNYTVYGDYFWMGKGYGINLADSDGFQVDEERSLRSPHSIHLSILARSGVPGLAAWILFNLTFAVSMLMAFLRSRARGQITWSSIHLFILAYWLAFIANASFDVYLEGPQGGIWFWSLIGFGLAALELSRREERDAGRNL